MGHRRVATQPFIEVMLLENGKGGEMMEKGNVERGICVYICADEAEALDLTYGDGAAERIVKILGDRARLVPEDIDTVRIDMGVRLNLDTGAVYASDDEVDLAFGEGALLEIINAICYSANAGGRPDGLVVGSLVLTAIDLTVHIHREPTHSLLPVMSAIVPRQALQRRFADISARAGAMREFLEARAV